MNDPAQPWLDSARISLDSAEYQLAGGRWVKACFEAQQTVELMLKAAIVHSGSALPKVHGLLELATHLTPELCQQLQEVLSAFADLESYYSSTRYPDARVGNLPEREEAEQALDVARHVAEVVEAALR